MGETLRMDHLKPHNGSPLGVCVLPPPAPNAPRPVRCGEYVHEMLGHAGLCYDSFDLEELPTHLDRLEVLVTVGESVLEAPLREQLSAWVDGGGAWLSIGGLCGMGELLGAAYRAPDFVLWGGALRLLGEGYLEPRAGAHPILRGLPIPLHFFNGLSVEARGAEAPAGALDAHGRPADSPAVLERAAGRGRTLLVAPDLTGTVLHVQQGIPVVRDGAPAPDGAGPVSDGVLKTDDGQVLDWILDRQEVPGAPGLRAFLQPVADQWRDLLLRAIFYLADRQGVTLPLLWFYPEGLPALGHLSHDTDGSDPELARALLAALERAGAPGTWCVILPGYDRELLGAIRSAGHELAAHFDAMSAGRPWSEEHFDAQWRELSALLGEAPVTNKNHYLRWEGDTEFFEWCVARGIHMDQSKGASKTGEAGFNFGACHPYRPVTAAGRLLPVLELPTPTQDLLIFAPEALAAPLLDAVARHYGILHLLFHPAHIAKPGVADALVNAVRAGQERGLAWWTARDISAWENARRAAVWTGFSRGASGCRVSLQAPFALPGAAILWLAGRDLELSAAGVRARAETVERWGFRFLSVCVDLEPGSSVELAVTYPSGAADS